MPQYARPSGGSSPIYQQFLAEEQRRQGDKASKKAGQQQLVSGILGGVPIVGGLAGGIYNSTQGVPKGASSPVGLGSGPAASTAPASAPPPPTAPIGNIPPVGAAPSQTLQGQTATAAMPTAAPAAGAAPGAGGMPDQQSLLLKALLGLGR